MTKPTREQILAAHYATEQLVLLATVVRESPAVKDYREMILKALPPRPQPTMADVEWDDDVHYLAEATHLVYETVLMLGRDSDDAIKFLALNRADSKTVWGQPRDLTPTGRRYTLTEVHDD